MSGKTVGWLQLVIGVLLVLVGAVNVYFATVSPSTHRYIAAILPIVAGLIAVIRGLGSLAPESEDEPVEHEPLPVDPVVDEPSPLWRPGLVRGAGMTLGTIGWIGGSTWLVYELSEGFAVLPIVTLLAGAGLFGASYGTGLRVQRVLSPLADRWDRTAAWLLEHGAVPALLLLTAVTAMMFTRVFFGETTGDDLTFHMAESRRLADCIASGDWDLWNPSANGGYASAYYYQVIPQLLSALPAALFGDHLFWFQVTLWLPQVLIPLCAYRGMRLMGASPWQAFCAAFAVTFLSGQSRWGSGADGTFQVGLYTQTWALAAFPLGLGHAVRYLLEGKGLPNAIAWGTFVFLCHPFASIALCAGLAFGVLAHYLQFPVRGAQVRNVLLAILGLAIAINLYKLVTDPVPPPKPGVEIDWKPQYVYIAPLILLAGLTARVVLRGKQLTRALLAGVAIALIANAIGLAVWEAVPKRPEGATEDLPAQWWWSGGASLYVGPLVMLAALAGRLALSLRRTDEEPPAPPKAMPVLWFGLATLGAGAGALAALKVHVALGGAIAFGSLLLMAWFGWRAREQPLVRLVVLGACLAVATVPGWLTVIVDRDGFGGFPHRVNDEVGPGYQELMRWFTKGALLDNGRLVLLTWSLPLVVLFARMRFGRWLWTPALLFAALLALGPHAPKTADDLLPAVRFLGAMQVILGLAIGAGLFAIGSSLWHMRAGSPMHKLSRLLGGDRPDTALVYGVRTGLLAAAAVFVVILGIGGRIPAKRVFTLPHDYDYRDELVAMNAEIAKLPAGKKQVGQGAENHWWNMLSYVYVRRPSLLQMGGGGLQASPNYDFVWSVRDFHKLAWVYDVPLFLYARANEANAPAGDVLFQTARYELRKLAAPGPVSAIHLTGVLPAGESRAGSEVRKAAIDWLKSSAPMENQHLAYAGHAGHYGPPHGKVVRAFRVDPSPGELADFYAELDVEQTTTFVIRESWHPRWHAYVDGVEVPVRRVTPDFPAVDVGPGEHVLALRFERPWWANAAWLLWPGVAIAAWLIGRRFARVPPARVVP